VSVGKIIRTIESTISICRAPSANVKRWRDGQMRGADAPRERAGNQFRRVNGHLHLPSLRDTLKKVTTPVVATGHDVEVCGVRRIPEPSTPPDNRGHR
jgi:putative transposase